MKDTFALQQSINVAYFCTDHSLVYILFIEVTECPEILFAYFVSLHFRNSAFFEK